MTVSMHGKEPQNVTELFHWYFPATFFSLAIHRQKNSSLNKVTPTTEISAFSTVLPCERTLT